MLVPLLLALCIQPWLCHVQAQRSTSDPGCFSPAEETIDEGQGGHTCLLQTALTLTTPSRKDLVSASPMAATANRKSPSQDGRYRQAMYNYHDMQYWANLSIGSQAFRGILDTGSFELLVLSKECKSCGDVNTSYDYSKSASYLKGSIVSTHSFGSGSTTSFEGFDAVAVGPLVAKNQSFWEIVEADMPLLLDESDFQAIVGVGPPESPSVEAWSQAASLESTVRRFSWLGHFSGRLQKAGETYVKKSYDIAKQTSKKSTLLDTLEVKRFSICLNPRPGKPGYFVWNDEDPKKKTDIFTAIPVVASHTWGVKMEEVVLSSPGAHNKDILIGCTKGCGAIVDSGTSLLILPSAVVKGLASTLALLGSACDNINKFPRLKFNLGGQALSLPPTAYLGRVDTDLGEVAIDGSKASKAVCTLTLMVDVAESESQFGPLVILGLPFLRQYYTTFELGSSDNSNRSLYVSLGDRQCEPTKAVDTTASGTSFLDVRDQLVNVDTSKLRRPDWTSAAKLGKAVRI